MDEKIMKRADAIKWLKEQAKHFIDDYEQGDYDAEEVGDMVRDLLGDVERINISDWEWVAIIPCEMSASKVDVRQAKIINYINGD